MPSSQDIANDSAATFAAYPELVTKIDAGSTVPDSDLDQWIGASYANFVDGCLEQINEVFVGSRAIAGRLRIADAPATGYNSAYDDLVIGDGSTSVGITLYTGTANSGGLAWWANGTTNDAIVRYNSTNDCLILAAGQASSSDASMNLCVVSGAGALEPKTSGQSTDLGRAARRWRDLALKRHAYIDPETAPATPSSGAVLYVDSADGALKVKFSTGTTTTLASP